jgi:hypothetical protein
MSNMSNTNDTTFGVGAVEEQSLVALTDQRDRILPGSSPRTSLDSTIDWLHRRSQAEEMLRPLPLTARPLAGAEVASPAFIDRPERQRVQRLIERQLNALIVGRSGSGKTTLLHRLEYDLGAAGQPVIRLSGRNQSQANILLALLEHFDAATQPVVERELLSEPVKSLLAAAQRRDLSAALQGRIAAHAERETIDPLDTLLQRETIDPLDTLLHYDLSDEQHWTVLIDDIDPSVGYQLFGTLRDEMWQLPITWIITCYSSDERELTRPPANAFFSQVVELEPFNDDQTAALIAARAHGHQPVLSREDITLLASALALDKPSPGQIIRCLQQLMIGAVTIEEIAQRAQIIATAQEQLSPQAAYLYSYLVDAGPKSAADEDLLAHTALSRQRLGQLFAELSVVGLVDAESVRSQGRPRKVFSVKRIGDWDGA